MKILVIQQKMIGDVLTSSILFDALRKSYGTNVQLDYLINEHTYPVVQNNINIDDYIFFTKEHENSKIALFKLGLNLRKKKYDIVIDVYCKLSSNLLSFLSKAKKRISYHKYYSSYIYTDTIQRLNKGKNKAIIDRMQLLSPLKNTSSTTLKPKIYLTPNEINEAKDFLMSNKIDLNRPIFMISVLGSEQKKTYPFNYMAEIIDFIVIKTNGQVLLNYIPKQKDEAKAIFDLCQSKTQTNIFFNTYGKSLRAFLGITSYCSALIGNEGGAINMAKALDIPTFSIFSPWIEKESWDLFENQSNISVHLKDFHPQLFKKSGKELKKITSELYQEFSPKLFSDKLNCFLENLATISNN